VEDAKLQSRIHVDEAVFFLQGYLVTAPLGGGASATIKILAGHDRGREFQLSGNLNLDTGCQCRLSGGGGVM